MCTWRLCVLGEAEGQASRATSRNTFCASHATYGFPFKHLHTRTRKGRLRYASNIHNFRRKVSSVVKTWRNKHTVKNSNILFRMRLILLYDEQNPKISSRTGQTCWKITGEPDSSYKTVASKTSQPILCH